MERSVYCLCAIAFRFQNDARIFHIGLHSIVSITHLYCQHCAKCKASVFSSVRGRFLPPGTTHCTDWGEICREGVNRRWTPSQQISSPLVQGWCGAQKLKIFTKFWKISALYQHTSCTVCTKFSVFVGSFMMGHILKFGEIQSRDSRIRGYNLRWSGYYQIFSAP